MHFSGPVLLIAGPLMASFFTFLLSRWQRAAALAGTGFAWVLWAMLTAVPLQPTAVEQAGRLFAGDTLLIFGRSLILTEGIQALFQFAYLALSLLFLLSLFLPSGRRFVSVTLAVYALLASALMIRPFTFGALLLPATAALLVVVIQAGRAGSTQAALRYLLIITLTMPPLLVAGWMLETEQPFLTSISRLLAISFLMLLAGFPFHLWLSPVVAEAPALVSTFILGIVQLMMATFVFNLLLANPWLQQDEPFLQILRLSGTVTVLVAGVLATTARDFGRLWGSLVLLDVGMAVLALLVAGVEGWQTAVSLHLARFFSLLLTGVGLSLLRRQSGSTVLAAISGLGRQAPFSLALFTYGALSLIGLPLTIGFGSRWAVMAAVSRQAPAAIWLPALLLLGTAACLYGLIRALVVLWSLPTETIASDEMGMSPAEHPWLRALVGVTLAISLAVAVWPQVWLGYAYRLAALFG